MSERDENENDLSKSNKISILEIKKIIEFENISDDEAGKIIDTLIEFSNILYDSFFFTTK